jgi:hypothetical protein
MRMSGLLGKKFVAVTLFAIAVAFCVLSMPFCSCATVTQGDAISAIVAAQTKLVVCYRAVANASDAGANVTGLIQVLDQAAGNLSRAYLAYNMGDYASAQNYAEQSLNLLVQNDVTAQVGTLESSAYLAHFWSGMITVLSTLVGVVVVVCGGLVVWVLLKRRYEKTGSAAE